MGRHTLLTVVIVQAMGLGMLAYAADRGDREKRAGDREPAAVTRMQQNSDRANSRLKGTLACEQASENIGTACLLKLTEQDTGRIYEIRGSNEAMRLFHDGTREVSIVGRASGDQLKVLEIRAL